MTFGKWLKRARPCHYYERDFRMDALYYSDEDDSFIEEDFSDVRDLLDNMQAATRGGRPCSAAIEGAVRCWVRWRQSEKKIHESHHRRQSLPS